MSRQESAIQRDIIKTLESIGCYVVNCVVTGKAGTPDLIVCHPDAEGKFIALEVKRPGEKPREIQYHHMRKIRESGGIALCVHSVSDALAQIGGVIYGYD